ncbi:MAG TPA: helix-turn-helix transcriptional regulator [Actinophytocola sp.]|nr:helix-turn-helix transcriptional regulator [Actinophytocola sp.]
MAKQQSGVNTRGIGLELQRLRKDRKLSVKEVGARLGISASTISRMETGKREPTSEEVASILTAIKVIGVEREQLIDRARRQDQPNMLESSTSTEQGRNFLNFEQRATRIFDFGFMLVPGLWQTADYAHAALAALRVQDREEDLEPWVGLRMRRQAILTRRNPPELHWILTELSLRQPLGGPKVMSKQIRQLVDLAERPNITIQVLPAKVAAHPGLAGSFMIMEFAADPTVVFVEDKTTGLFLDDPDKVAIYKLTAEKLTDLALDEQGSLRLLETIARDLTRE